MKTKITTGPLLFALIFFGFSLFFGLSFWWSMSLVLVGYFIGIDEEDKKNAIKNGDDLSRWPKEKAKRDFQEWLNKP